MWQLHALGRSHSSIMVAGQRTAVSGESFVSSEVLGVPVFSKLALWIDGRISKPHTSHGVAKLGI